MGNISVLDMWGFSNISANIALPIYRRFFGPIQAKELFEANEGLWWKTPHGVCEGMCIAALASIEKKSPFISSYNNAKSLFELKNAETKSSTTGLSALDYIKYAHVFQFTPVAHEDINDYSKKHNLEMLYNAVKNSAQYNRDTGKFTSWEYPFNKKQLWSGPDLHSMEKGPDGYILKENYGFISYTTKITTDFLNYYSGEVKSYDKFLLTVNPLNIKTWVWNKNIIPIMGANGDQSETYLKQYWVDSSVDIPQVPENTEINLAAANDSIEVKATSKSDISVSFDKGDARAELDLSTPGSFTVDCYSANTNNTINKTVISGQSNGFVEINRNQTANIISGATQVEINVTEGQEDDNGETINSVESKIIVDNLDVNKDYEIVNKNNNLTVSEDSNNDGTFDKVIASTPSGSGTDPDGTIHNKDGSVQTIDGTYIRPAKCVLKEEKTTGNCKKISVAKAPGAQGYDFILGKTPDCLKKKQYFKVNKNVHQTSTKFSYLPKGTYYVAAHAWLRGVNAKKIFGSWSEVQKFEVTSITPSTPKITSVKVKGKNVTITYSKCKNASGYDAVLGSRQKKVNGETCPIEYGKLVKKITKGTTVTITFANVPKGTYYAGVHAWNRARTDGKKVFSPWSNIKKIII